MSITSPRFRLLAQAARRRLPERRHIMHIGYRGRGCSARWCGLFAIFRLQQRWRFRRKRRTVRAGHLLLTRPWPGGNPFRPVFLRLPRALDALRSKATLAKREGAMPEDRPRLTAPTLRVLGALMSSPLEELSGADVARIAKLGSGTLYPNSVPIGRGELG